MKKTEYIIKNYLDKQGNIDKIGRILLQGEDHVKNGYKSNEGRGRCIRKDGSFDYLKMSRLFHENKW